MTTAQIESPSDTTTGRVLVIDDDDGVRFVVQHVLERAGYEVVTAADGLAGIEAARREEFDVAIVDYEMPTANGVEVLHRLRELRPECSRILSSGCADAPVITEAVNRGEISRVVPKPASPLDLRSAVKGALEARSHAAELHAVWEAKHRARERRRFEALVAGPDLALAVQPIVRADDGVPAAYEALLRSRAPDFPGPLHVLQAAESHEMVGDLASRVVDCARAWLEEIPGERKLFVNLHPEELRDPEGLAARLDPLRPIADRIVLEITERAGAQGTNDWTCSIAMLRMMGFQLAVDDLGSGYSSLSILAEVKPEYVKIDMSIVRDVDRDEHKRHIVELICAFAHTTNATIIAEGIETEAEAATLRACGVELLQGYLFARPSLELPADPT